VNQYQVYSTVPEYSITQYQKSAAYKFHSLLHFTTVTTATEPQHNQNHVSVTQYITVSISPSWIQIATTVIM